MLPVRKIDSRFQTLNTKESSRDGERASISLRSNRSHHHSPHCLAPFLHHLLHLLHHPKGQRIIRYFRSSMCPHKLQYCSHRIYNCTVSLLKPMIAVKPLIFSKKNWNMPIFLVSWPWREVTVILTYNILQLNQIHMIFK